MTTTQTEAINRAAEIYQRTVTPTGVPIYTSRDGRVVIEARMSRSRIVGSAMVFGQWVHENDHKPHPVAWTVYVDGQHRGQYRTLREAKRRPRPLVEVLDR